MFRALRRLRGKLSSLIVRGLVRRAARRQGFLDPVPILDRLRQLAQPSEVNEPIELLRAAAAFHSRGLLNARAIQHNLDWVWPYWVQRQFDPHSRSFITRGFSATHVNLTHRNWTAVGVPDCPLLPIVDPRGLVTPFHDGWSLDGWVLLDSGQTLLPSTMEDCRQRLVLDEDGLRVLTELETPWALLRIEVGVEAGEGGPHCVVRYSVTPQGPGWLAVSARPCNPEGVSAIYSIRPRPSPDPWVINRLEALRFPVSPDRVLASNYWAGDVFFSLPDGAESGQASCKAGMATAAALYRIEGKSTRTVEARVLLSAGAAKPLCPRFAKKRRRVSEAVVWKDILTQTPVLKVPSEPFMRLYREALCSLVLHSPEEVYPGPFTYKRFWFRDAAFILNALLKANLHSRVRRCLDTYPIRQTVGGYFHSQDGEWDSNGEAIWILSEYLLTTGSSPGNQWLHMIARGADWIRRKRSLSADRASPHAGLLPSGFSAEHLGPNDFYYWDNFWSAAGLDRAARLLEANGRSEPARRFAATRDRLMESVEASLEHGAKRRGDTLAYPASPYRRMESGAIGSIVASYPLQLLPPGHKRLRATVEYLLENCMVHGGFFQENIHSGINAYLTLHLAQALLRERDARFFPLVGTVADLATSTGQWPEAVHPATGGGCMGDGHHVWASAEWFMILRNMFVREEEGRLVLAEGLPESWLQTGQELSFGPASTQFGTVSVTCRLEEGRPAVSWALARDARVERIEVALPGCEPMTVDSPAASRTVHPRPLG